MKGSKKKILICTCVIVVLAMIFFNVKKKMESSVETQIAYSGSFDDTIQIRDVLLVRDEMILPDGNFSGVASYLIESGDRVYVDEPIVAFYGDQEAAVNQSKLSRIDKEIEKLKQTFSGMLAASTTPESIDKQICHKLRNMVLDLNKRDYESAVNDGKMMQYLLSKKCVTTGESDNLENKIKELYDERKKYESFSSNVLSEVKAPCSGYFMKNLDGYENIVSKDELCSLTALSLRERIVSRRPVNENSVGKIVSSYNWYVACNISREDVGKIKQYENVRICLYTASPVPIECKIVSVNENSDDDIVLVLKCDQISSDVLAARNYDTAKIICNTFDGFRVQKSAFCEKKISKTVKNDNGTEDIVTRSVPGVYVMNGADLEFRQIEPLFCSDSFVICTSVPDEDLFADDSLQLYDRVAVGGRKFENKKMQS